MGILNARHLFPSFNPMAITHGLSSAPSSYGKIDIPFEPLLTQAGASYKTQIHKDGVTRVTETTVASESVLDISKGTGWMTAWGRADAGCHAGNLFSVLRSRMTMQRFSEQESVSSG
jgi:hypothetical protein